MPETITVLDSNCKLNAKPCPHGWPNSMTNWVIHEAREATGTQYWAVCMYWWSNHTNLYEWLRTLMYKNDDKLHSILLSAEEPNNISKLSPSAHTIYNLVWCHLGYTEGQPQWILDLAEYASICPTLQTIKSRAPVTQPPPPKQITKRKIKQFTKVKKAARM